MTSMAGPQGNAKETPKRRDSYEVLGITKDAKEEHIKSAYRRLALKYHPDKNANNPDATDQFKEIAFAYSLLSDPEKRRAYDTNGFDAIDLADLDDSLDLSNLNTFNTAVVALFSKLGVPIKTSISATVLEEALNGTITVRPLPLGRPVSDRVERQVAHYFGVTIDEEQAKAGLVVRVTSSGNSKFKLLYFEQDLGGYSILMQENSVKTGKVTSAGFYFLGYQVHRLDPTVNALEVAKDPEAALFKKLESLQPCELNSLRAGTHVFAVYGDNFFKNAAYTIVASSGDENLQAKDSLKELEEQLVAKRNSLRQFETEYRQAMAKYLEVAQRLTEEKVEVESLLTARYQTQERLIVVQPAAPPAPRPSPSSSSTSFWGTSHTPPPPEPSPEVASPAPEGPPESEEAKKAREAKKWSFNLPTFNTSKGK